MRAFSFFFIVIFIAQYASSQVINPPAGVLFDDDVVPRIDVILPQDSLEWILDAANLQSNHEFQATFIFDNGTIRDTIDDIGFRLRGNTSRTSEKKSFKISMNTFAPGRNFFGVEKINLNGEHNDPTIARSKTCWYLADAMGLPASRSNHVNLYINNQYRGIYLNVEHIDEEFVEKRFGNKNGNLYKCLYPADLTYKGTNPDLYKADFFGRRIYELKTNEARDDYSDFAAFINVLNNTPLSDLPCELEALFNVDQYLKAIVFDVLAGNWDGPIYNKNNFYLYHDQQTGLFEYIPYDLDNTLGIDWLGRDWGTRNIYSWRNSAEPRPIYSRLMAVPEYRDRYSYYLNEAIQSTFTSGALGPYLDSIRDRLAPHVPQDTFYPRSYGFTMQDFRNGYDQTLSYRQTAYGIKPYINTRRSEAMNQLQLNDITPIITQSAHNHPLENEPVMFTALVKDDNTISDVKLCYHTGNPSAETCLTMLDDGQNGDGAANDGIYGISIPALNRQTVLEYYTQATDNQSHEARAPRCDYDKVYVGSSSLPIAINEIMASNEATIADNAGEYEDWIEVYNYGADPIYLGDKYLSDNQNDPTKWLMPDRWIGPGEFVLFWADDDVSQGDHHANFKLSKSGEFVGLFDNQSSGFGLVDGTTFPAQTTDIAWARIPNGTGAFTSQNPTPRQSNTTVSIVPFWEKNIAFSAYPSPFEDELSIKITNPEKTSLMIECVDMLGRVWGGFGTNENNVRRALNLADAPKGLLMIRVRSEGRLVGVRKVVRR